MEKVRLLALSGSLRKGSYHTALITTLDKLSPPEVEVNAYLGLGFLPLFNPDRQKDNIPAVSMFRNELNKADALVIASPGYAKGVSSVLKNALEWIANNDKLRGLPVVIFNAENHEPEVNQALLTILDSLSVKVAQDACLSLPMKSCQSHWCVDSILTDSQVSAELAQALAKFTLPLLATKKQRQQAPLATAEAI